MDRAAAPDVYGDETTMNLLVGLRLLMATREHLLSTVFQLLSIVFFLYAW